MTTKILITDDDYVDLETIKRHLRKEDYQISTACSGEEAIQCIKNDSSIELVLLDAMMPGLSGFETCIEIKKINSEIPVILVTGLTDEKSLKHAFDSGAIDFISKPVKKLEVISRINNALSIKRAEKEVKKLYNNLVKDIELAQCVQSYLVADWLSITDKYTMSVSYSPASGVSGDLYDIVQLAKDKYLLYVGDISGHGVQASLIMAAIQMAIKFEVLDHKEKLDIVHVLNKLNNIFAEKFSNTNYMTFIIGILDFSNDTFSYFSAGHPPLITYNKETGKAELRDEKGSLPIGLFSKNEYTKEDLNKLHLDCNTGLMLYTDGLFECNTPEDEKFDLNNLVSIISQTSYTSSASLPEEILTSLKNKSFDFDDDVTILFIDPHNFNSNIISKSIEPDLDKIQELRLDIIAKLEANQLSETLVSKCELLIVEHLNNLAIHGMKNLKLKRLSNILISIKINEDNTINIETCDKYSEWDFESHINKIKNKSESQDDIMLNLNVSGRGWSIIDNLADDYKYRRFNELNYYKFTISESD